MKLALYKGPARSWLDRLYHRAVCWGTSSIYSHCELVIGDVCCSASARDGGVRTKLIDLSSDRWDVIDLPQFDLLASQAAWNWFVEHKGSRYDWLGLLAFVLPWRLGSPDRYFCSEAIAAALLLDEPSRYSPQDLLLVCKNGMQAMRAIHPTHAPKGI